jgi:hypothetical protein
MTTPTSLRERITHACFWLAHPRVLFFTLPYLMIVLIVGTVAQKYMGLYAAQKMFFAAPILWLGFVPLPGMPLALLAITVSLLAKFFFSSPWHLQKIGINLSHLGILLLLIGGLVTALSQKEGFLMIPEGGQSRIVQDYHGRILTVSVSGTPVATFPFETLHTARTLNIPGHPFRITIEKQCRNCMPSIVTDADGRKGKAEKVTLNNVPPEKEDEQNISGLEISISDLDKKSDGVYVLMDRMSPQIEAGDYTLSLGRRETILPFSIRLNRFDRDFHPGTMDARAYRAHVSVIDGNTEWPVTIAMNEPLRYKGYTLYQSSFIDDPSGMQTVLSVVQNRGRAFPYLASAIIFLGLFIHVLIRLKRERGTGRTA